MDFDDEKKLNTIIIILSYYARMTRCQYLKKKAGQCKNSALSGLNVYCHVHKNYQESPHIVAPIQPPVVRAPTATVPLITSIAPQGRQSSHKSDLYRILKENVSTFLYLFIVHLKENVYFDYETREILFVGGTVSIDDLNLDYLDPENSPQLTQEQIQSYIGTHFTDKTNWFDVIVLPDLTELEMKNKSGFNDDPRSHRGDILHNSETIIAKRIETSCTEEDDKKTEEDDKKTEKDDKKTEEDDKKTEKDDKKTEKDVDEEDEDDDEDDEDDDEDDEENEEIYSIDEQCQDNPWETSNDKGLTWGDIMEGIMLIKGSKSDWWYELIGGVDALIDGQTLSITISPDHGS